MPPKKSTLTPVLTLESPMGIVYCVSYFPNGKRIVSGSSDKTTREWNLETGKEIKKARHVCKQKVHTIEISRDGRWVVSAGGDSENGELEIREVATGTVRTSRSQRISCVDISGDSTLLVSGSCDGTVRIWSLETAKLAAGPIKSADSVGAVRFSQNSKKLAVKSFWGKYLEVWDIQSQKLDASTAGGSIYSPDVPVFWTTRDTIVTTLRFARTRNQRNGMIYEFNASTLKTIGAPIKGHTSRPIIGLALSLDCALLVSATSDNTIKLWHFQSRQLLASFKILSVHSIILSPDSRQLVYTARGKSNTIHLCNIPPEILTRIQPIPRVRTSAPINLPLADLGALSITTNQFNNEASPNVQQSLPYPRRDAGSESWSDRQVGTSRIQPAQIQPLTDMWQQPADMRSLTDKTLGKPHELGFQPLRQDTLHSDAGPMADLPSTTISPAIVLPHISQTLSSTVGSRLPQLPPDLDELLPSSSHTHTVSSVRHDELHDLPPEVMLQDLTGYITKDEEYPVARGGFGEIWKCTFNIDRRPTKVAVKALQVYVADQLGAAKTKKIKRIIRELRICANLKHPNILRVYGYTYGFGPFVAIVSPWAGNGNLTDYLELEGVALTLVRRFQILKDIIAGLQYLHTNSVIHGDFTGPNVLILDDGTACVADFGLSLMYSEVISASQASWTSTLKGNMRWMAPELLVEREDGSQVRPSEQSDMYSFGGIMLQVLTNKAPYYHLTNDAAIVLCIAKSQTPSRSRYPDLPEKYWQLIEKCWSTDPQDRPSTEGADVMIRNEFYSLLRFH